MVSIGELPGTRHVVCRENHLIDPCVSMPVPAVAGAAEGICPLQCAAGAQDLVSTSSTSMCRWSSFILERSHICRYMSFDKIFDLTAGVYFNFYNTYIYIYYKN